MTMPVRQIMISDSSWKWLHKDVWSDQFAEAFYKKSGKRVPIKIRVRGGHTRTYPKKSYEIRSKGRTVHLNAEFDDPSMIRNALSFRFFERIGVPSPRTSFSLLEINRKNRGVYLEIEAVDRAFFRRRKIPFQSLFYATNDDANFGLISPETNRSKSSLFDGYHLIIGGEEDRNRLKSFISNLNSLGKKELWTYLSTNLDIDNYLRWLAGAVLTGNYDGFNQNYALYWHKKRRCFRIIPWDYEGTWGRDSYGKYFGSRPVPITGRNTLTHKLLAYPSVRKRYKAILRQILKSSFTTRKLSPLINQLHGSISKYVENDKTREHSPQQFRRERNFIKQYIKKRRKVILEEMAKL